MNVEEHLLQLQDGITSLRDFLADMPPLDDGQEAFYGTTAHLNNSFLELLHASKNYLYEIGEVEK